MEKSLWRKLVYLWCTVEDKNGLTLPFLIGAEREFGDRQNFSLDTLFEELQASSQPYIISRFDDIEEYVIGLPKREYPFLSSLPKYGSLYINTPFLEGFDSILKIQEQLSAIYEENIQNKKYSKTIGFEYWSEFDGNDQNKIRTAMEM
ncbi:hypothetical protein DBR40_22235 [Pedobacter sp. KBW01]|uniref:hypothetical protein n=1 Tax=Pedobacter sp. KBW01 TaxID=2153364 RepID=UPI000F5A5FA7|nr:hypothetical protein [Pedobacter sp. KBW01]RQO66601.1 hypothetical protein DBR40_22235 [Pedobacter sp. KBW01]